jgi:hypothetical protein
MFAEVLESRFFGESEFDGGSLKTTSEVIGKSARQLLFMRESKRKESGQKRRCFSI